MVEETPGRLEYEVALYREATGNVSDATTSSQAVDQAVPIGTKLQLRARISAESAWGYIKLIEVTVSPDPDQPHAPGSVVLVKDGCRNRDFASIIPHQPARYREKKNEVFLDFEAFLLSSMRERSTLWIHSQIKACMEPHDCQPVIHLKRYFLINRNFQVEFSSCTNFFNSNHFVTEYFLQFLHTRNTQFTPNNLIENVSSISISFS